SSRNETHVLMDKLDKKDEEIEKFSTSNRSLSDKLDNLFEHNLNLKSQLLTLLDPQQATQKADTSHLEEEYVPKVLLIGTSNTKGIKEDKVTNAVKIHKSIQYTIDEATTYITQYEEQPNLVILHILTNDLKKYEPTTCVDKLMHLVHLIGQKWTQSKCLISLATPRADDINHHTNENIELSPCYGCRTHKHAIRRKHHDDTTISDDKYHLNDKGTSILANNLKHAIHSTLNITIQRNRSRSRSRNTNSRQVGRGRGRGRGLMGPAPHK
ncbi:Hypothetical predicted protein, partial [Mytilus galloprovincialis]